MPWASTREAPPCEWSWVDRDGLHMHPEEQAACDDVARVLAEQGTAFGGVRVVEVGCGRGACLHYARSVLGASAVFGLDPSAGAVDATLRTIGEAGGKARRLGDEGAVEEAVAFGADLAWSHGVVEHLDGDEAIRAHVELLARVSRRWVAISAPNPSSPVYAEWRRRRLDAENWPWGFEEPLAGYGDVCRAVGLDVVFDGATARTRDSMNAFLATLELDDVPANEPGLYTLVVARVPVTGGP